MTEFILHKVSRIKKRFIAGATCPECKAFDSIAVFEEGGVQRLQCVSCGYEERQPEAPSSRQPKAEPVKFVEP